MNTQSLLDMIQKKLQDDAGFNRSTHLLPLLNEGLLFTARQRPLPELRTEETITTVEDQNQVDLPKNYHTHLFAVYNEDKKKPCRLCYNLNTLARMYGNDANTQGEVEAVATEGDAIIHYRRIPDDPEDLRLTFYEKPPLLVDSEESIPKCLPFALRRQILVNYVLWQVFESIEDGVEGQKIGTQYHASEYAAGVMMLEKFLPDVSRPRHYYPRKARTF